MSVVVLPPTPLRGLKDENKLVSLFVRCYKFHHMRSTVIQKNMFYGAKRNIFINAKMLRRNMTLPELVLWSRLRDRKVFNVKFRRQHPIDIFIVDFYCHELKLVIEVDGEVHNDRKEYDSGREAELNKYGIKVLRLTNHQVIFDLKEVVKTICQYLDREVT
jgi:very-short-patch-repair endonuclease